MNTSHLNGVSERDGCSLANMTRRRLKVAGFPKALTDEMLFASIPLTYSTAVHTKREGTVPHDAQIERQLDASAGDWREDVRTRRDKHYEARRQGLGVAALRVQHRQQSLPSLQPSHTECFGEQERYLHRVSGEYNTPTKRRAGRRLPTRCAGLHHAPGPHPLLGTSGEGWSPGTSPIHAQGEYLTNMR